MRNPLFILFLLLSINASGQYLPPGSDAINFSARSVGGKDFKLSDLEGKYVLLDFTATGCAPCWKSYPHLTEIQDKFKNDLQVVTFHVFDTLKTRWSEMAAERNIRVNWIQLWDVEEKEKIMKQYMIDGMPIYYLIDPKGKIVSSWFGYKRSKLDRELKQLHAKN
jgi:peroxiredoxin